VKQYPINYPTAPVTLTQVERLGSATSYFDFSSTAPLDANGVLSQFFNLSMQPVEVQVAQYGKLHSRVNSELMVSATMNPAVTGNAKTPSIPTNFVNIQTMTSTFTSSAIAIARSVSDDFQLGYFVGVPPMSAY